MPGVTSGEAGQDRDLLLELGLADEGPPPPTPVEVALGGEMDEGLADGREADAPLLCQGTLRRQSATGGETASDDLLTHQVVDLAVQRHKRAAMHRKRGQPAVAAAVRPDVLVTRHRGRHLLHLPMVPWGGGLEQQ